jgi:hypothetical protein
LGGRGRARSKLDTGRATSGCGSAALIHQTIYAAALLGILGGLIVIRFARTPALRRKAILLVITYIVATHLVIGVTQKDAWPVTNYCLMHGNADLRHGELYRYAFVGIDRSGREWQVDPYAWRGLSDWHLQLWFYINFEKLPAADQREALAFLYQLAEQQRMRFAAGRTSPSWLGPLSAPQWWLFPRHLSVPPESYRALRVYKDTWVPATILFDHKPINRKNIGEWRAN